MTKVDFEITPDAPPMGPSKAVARCRSCKWGVTRHGGAAATEVLVVSLAREHVKGAHAPPPPVQRYTLDIEPPTETRAPASSSRDFSAQAPDGWEGF